MSMCRYLRIKCRKMMQRIRTSGRMVNKRAKNVRTLSYNKLKRRNSRRKECLRRSLTTTRICLRKSLRRRRTYVQA